MTQIFAKQNFGKLILRPERKGQSSFQCREMHIISQIDDIKSQAGVIEDEFAKTHFDDEIDISLVEISKIIDKILSDASC